MRSSADVDRVLLMLLLLASAASSTALKNCNIFTEDAKHASPDQEPIMQYTTTVQLQCTATINQNVLDALT